MSKKESKLKEEVVVVEKKVDNIPSAKPEVKVKPLKEEQPLGNTTRAFRQ